MISAIANFCKSNCAEFSIILYSARPLQKQMMHGKDICLHMHCITFDAANLYLLRFSCYLNLLDEKVYVSQQTTLCFVGGKKSIYINNRAAVSENPSFFGVF